MASLPAERLGLRPGVPDQQQRLFEDRARLGRVDIVRHVFIRRATHHAGNYASIRQRIEHREFLGDTHRVKDRDIRPEQRDPRALHDLRQSAREHHRVWGEAHRPEVMLGDRYPVEAHVVRQPELLERRLHRPASFLRRVAGTGGRPAAGRRRQIENRREESRFHAHCLIPLGKTAQAVGARQRCCD